MKKFLLSTILTTLLVPFFVFADSSSIATIIFTTLEQSVAPNEISQAITIQTQNSSAQEEKVSETNDVTFTSTSATGEFLGSTGKAITKTMSNGSANKTFYYKDSTTGTHTLTVTITGRDSKKAFSASQSVGIGSSSQTNSTNTENNQTNTSSDEKTNSLSAYDSQAVAYRGNDASSFEISAGRDRLATVGVPISFEVKVKKPSGIGASQTNLIWSYGDGTRGFGNFVSHTYVFPGDYIVLVNGTYGEDSAVAKVSIKVVEPKVSVSNVTSDFIEITNQAQYEANMGKWILSSGKSNFVIPDDLLISPKKSVKLATSETKINPISEVNLYNPSRTLLSSHKLTYIPTALLGPNTEVTMPIGVNKEVLEKSLRMALADTKAVRLENAPPKESFVAVSDIPKPIPKSSNTAGVIFTVQSPNESGVMDKVLSLPRRGLQFIKNLIF